MPKKNEGTKLEHSYAYTYTRMDSLIIDGGKFCHGWVLCC